MSSDLPETIDWGTAMERMRAAAAAGERGSKVLGVLLLLPGGALHSSIVKSLFFTFRVPLLVGYQACGWHRAEGTRDGFSDEELDRLLEPYIYDS